MPPRSATLGSAGGTDGVIAALQAARTSRDRLAAIDRGYLRAHFPKLPLLDPSDR